MRRTLFRSLGRALAAGLLGGAAATAVAGPIPSDTFLQFGFDGVGSSAVGCDPADPAGAFCIPSSGTPTQFLDAPAWTFTAGAAGAQLTVIDAFTQGEVFEVFDFGVSLGQTSAVPAGAVDCGDDPVLCLLTGGMSVGVFNLAPGAHALTITLLQGDLGSAYLRVAGAQLIPEPPLMAAWGLALLAALRAKRRRGSAS